MLKINEIYNLDCLELLSSLPDKSVNCIVTSPPYWKGFGYEAYFNSYAQYLRWCEKWMRESKRVLKDDGNFFLNVINDSEITVRAFDLMNIATEILMWKLHDTIIWYRYNQQPANTTRQLTNQVEYIFLLRHSSENVCFDKESVYNNAPQIFKTKNVSNVWEIPFNHGEKSTKEFGRKETKSKWGHSGYPLLLPETCILLATKENDLVLDMFGGSGTTAVACIKHKRNYILGDKSENFVNLSKARIEQWTIQ